MKKSYQTEAHYKKLQVRIWGIAILVMLVIYFLTGAMKKGISMNGTAEGLRVRYGSDRSFVIKYENIKSLELRNDSVKGEAEEEAIDQNEIHYGSYRNDEFGVYTAAYNDKIPLWIIIVSTDGTYVINFENESSTSELFSQLEEITGLSGEGQTERDG